MQSCMHVCNLFLFDEIDPAAGDTLMLEAREVAEVSAEGCDAIGFQT